jgi:hypothetical protein
MLSFHSLKSKTVLFVLGVALLAIGSTLFFTVQGEAVPQIGTGATYYSDVRHQNVIGGWETNCSGNYSYFGSTSGRVHYYNLNCE